jgi:hypothetical protein
MAMLAFIYLKNFQFSINSQTSRSNQKKSQGNQLLQPCSKNQMPLLSLGLTDVGMMQVSSCILHPA